MQARRLPARRGWGWIVEGLRLFRANPPLLTFLVFGYWLTLVLLNLVPFAGIVLAPLCVPALSVSVMNGCRAIERGQAADAGLLFSGFGANRNALFVLGAAYLLGSLAVFAASALIDDGALLKILLSGQPPPDDLLANDQVLHSMQFMLLLTVPLLMAFWFAPLLTAWEGVAPAKSLFFSFVACARNWRAFFVYALGAFFLSVVLPGIVLGLAGASSPAVLRTLALIISLPLVFVFVPTLFASFYVGYRDIFVTGGSGA